jgi:hypothetical protein
MNSHNISNSGIVWDEEAVYKSLAGPPNLWPREVTYSNIIEKIDPTLVDGGEWDKDSIMHYPFEAGMILKPEKYRTEPLEPAGGVPCSPLYASPSVYTVYITVHAVYGRRHPYLVSIHCTHCPFTECIHYPVYACTYTSVSIHTLSGFRCYSRTCVHFLYK